jgi:hypothetical protein
MCNCTSYTRHGFPPSIDILMLESIENDLHVIAVTGQRPHFRNRR